MKTDKRLTDIHIHFCASERYGEFLEFCRTAGIRRAGLVSLPDLKTGNFNAAVFAAVKKAHGRFIGFGCLDYRKSRTESEGARQIEQMARTGFTGLKLWLGKPQVREDFRVSMEDEIITGALKAAGDLGLPVLIHLADPPPFWDEGGPYSRGDRKAGDFDIFDSWINRGRELFDRFPKVRFLGAHLLFLGGNLEKIDNIMECHPNLLLDTAPGRWFYRILGSRKKEAERFFNKYSSRILLGSDAMFFPENYEVLLKESLDDNLISFNRIMAFLTGSSEGFTGRIDDPFPHGDFRSSNISGTGGAGEKTEEEDEDRPGMIPCLDLPVETVELIMDKNAEELFGGGAF